MKFLGWMLLLSFTTVSAQEVIESTPLSVQDDGSAGRPIVEGKKDGTIILSDEQKNQVKIEAVEVKPESLEEVSAKTKKDVKKEVKAEKKSSKKMAAKKEAIAPIEPVASSVTSAPVQTPPNPQDGQLKLDASPVAVEVKVESKVEKKIEDNIELKDKESEKIETITVAIYEAPIVRKNFVQISYGYLHSRYSKIDPSLDNGSTLNSFRFVSDMTQRLQFGFAIEIIADKSTHLKMPDNIRAIQSRLFFDYHAPIRGVKAFDWLAGLALSIGDYGVNKRFINTAGQESSTNLKDGTLIGLIPSVGVRFYLVSRTSLDLVVEYHQYFGNPQSYIGGLAFSPRLSFEF